MTYEWEARVPATAFAAAERATYGDTLVVLGLAVVNVETSEMALVIHPDNGRGGYDLPAIKRAYDAQIMKEG